MPTDFSFPQLNSNAIGSRIKEKRKEHEYPVSFIVRKLRLGHSQTVYKWERGETIPNLDNIYALSRLFHCSVDELLGGSDSFPAA